LTSITSYSRLTVYDPNQNDGTIYPDEEITLRGGITAYTQELRLAGNALRNDALKWLIGGNYEYDSTSNLQSSNVHGSGSGLGPVPTPPGSGSGYPSGLYTFRWTSFNLFNDNTIKTAAVFSDLNYEIFKGLTAEGAVRFTDRRDAFAGCGADNGDGALAAGFSFLSSVFTNSPQVVPPGACATLRSDLKPLNTLFRDNLDEHNISYRAALSWKVTPTSLLYANVTKGYKGGAFETLPAIITSEFVSATQESVKAYEVGYKSFLFGRTVSLEGAVFYYDYLHKQTNGYINEPVFGTLPALVSVPTSLVRGAELSSLWRPIRGLTLNAAGTYIDSAVTSDFQLPGAFGGVSNVRGSPFPNTPKWQATGDIEYEWPVSSTLAAFAGSGVTYHSSTIAAFVGGPLLNVDSYALLDVRAGIQAADGRWRVQLWGHNVTNKYYWLSVEHQQDTVARTTGMPATFGISLTSRF
jgi:iron complex outermembrane recepter protein